MATHSPKRSGLQTVDISPLSSEAGETPPGSPMEHQQERLLKHEATSSDSQESTPDSSPPPKLRTRAGTDTNFLQAARRASEQLEGKKGKSRALSALGRSASSGNNLKKVEDPSMSRASSLSDSSDSQSNAGEGVQKRKKDESVALTDLDTPGGKTVAQVNPRQASHLSLDSREENTEEEEGDAGQLISKLTLSFRSSKLEHSFREFKHNAHLLVVTRSLWLGVVFFVVYTLLDIFWIRGLFVNMNADYVTMINTLRGIIAFVVVAVMALRYIRDGRLFQAHSQSILFCCVTMVGMYIVGYAWVDDAYGVQASPTWKGSAISDTSLLLLLIIYSTYIFHLLKLRFILAMISIIFAFLLMNVAAIAVGKTSTTDVLVNDLYIICALTINMFGAYMMEKYLRSDFLLNRVLEKEKQKSASLLKNMLPESVSERLKGGVTMVADTYEDVTILFCDIIHFSEMSARLSPADLLNLLNRIFDIFDKITDRNDVYKVETIANTYMVASGLPTRRPDHAEKCADTALDMLRAVRDFNQFSHEKVEIQLGIHSGPVVAGVLGLKMPRYHLWGDTVNTASRMLSHGGASRVQVSYTVHSRLKDKYKFVDRGILTVKGKGLMRCYFLDGKL